MKKGNKLVLGAALILLMAAGILLGFCLLNHNSAETNHIDVTLSIQHPPFDEYPLTDIEVENLIACLSTMDFSEYDMETTPPIGCGTICTITSKTENYIIELGKPYLVMEGNIYKLSLDAEIFKIVDRIIDAHQ